MLTRLNPFNQSRHPEALNRVVIATGLISLFLTLWDSLFSIPFQFPLLTSFFTLSLQGISHLYLWQFISYFFVMSTYGATINLFYILSSLITLYMIWILGTAIYDHGGKKQFLQLYFSSGIIAGLFALLAMLLLGVSIPLSGPTAPLLALFTAWTFLYPDVELMLFFVLPIRTKWLFAAIVGIIFLLALAQLDLISLFYYFSAISTAYAYCTMVWEIGSPFEITSSFDSKLISLGQRLRKSKGLANPREPKIIDIASGDALQNEDEFVDAMLQKISQKGQNSLTWSERKRLDEISKKKSGQ